MKKTKRIKRARRPIATEPPMVRRRMLPTRKAGRAVRLIAGVPFALGAMLLLKVVLTLREGTAWDDLSSSSQEAQPFEYWSFIVTYLLMAAFFIWLGVATWRPRGDRPRP